MIMKTNSIIKIGMTSLLFFTIFLFFMSMYSNASIEAASSVSELAESSSLFFSDTNTNKNVMLIILSFLGLGLGLSLTPCIFPMIPILSSIIIGQSSQKITMFKGFSLALSYVIGMASSYAMLGVIVSAFGSALNVSALTQSPIILTLSALLFIALSFSMFGLFELQLPSFIRNKLNEAGTKQKGGRYFSTFLMGFFAALVVSPCVSAPLAGALLYLSTTGNILLGASALFALGFGMGVPLLMIGLSGGTLLPKAGSWMNMIKSAFGVGLLIIAIELLDRMILGHITLMLYGVLSTSIGIFLINRTTKATLFKDNLNKIIAVHFFIFGVVWFVGGIMGNQSLIRPLSLSQIPHNIVQIDSIIKPVIIHDDVQKMQHTIQKLVKKGTPVIVDVYADWCTSCKDMDRFLHEEKNQTLLLDYQLIKFDITESTEEQLDYLSNLNIFGPPALQRYDLSAKPIGIAYQGVPNIKDFKYWLSLK
jgi:thiol:disulfide interchange protein DsbD